MASNDLDATMAFLDSLSGPTDAELSAIDDEWPLIAADLALTDAQITLIIASAPELSGQVRRVSRRNTRRAQRRLLRAVAGLLSRAAAYAHGPLLPLGQAA